MFLFLISFLNPISPPLTYTLCREYWKLGVPNQVSGLMKAPPFFKIISFFQYICNRKDFVYFIFWGISKFLQNLQKTSPRFDDFWCPIMHNNTSWQPPPIFKIIFISLRWINNYRVLLLVYLDFSNFENLWNILTYVLDFEYPKIILSNLGKFLFFRVWRWSII